MRRHVITVHADFKDDERIDDSESPENVGDEDSNKADNNDSSIQGDTDDDGDDDDEVGVEEEEEAEEDGKEEDSDDAWRFLIEEVFERCQSEFDVRVTKRMAKKWVDEEEAARKKSVR